MLVVFCYILIRQGSHVLSCLFLLQYEADHKELEAKLEYLKTMCGGVKEGSIVAELAKEMQDYETMMLPHLLEEEAQCLPLMRAYFTHQEIAPKVQEIIAEGPKVNYHIFVASSSNDKFCKIRTNILISVCCLCLLLRIR
jgi:hypothetical protein